MVKNTQKDNSQIPEEDLGLRIAELTTDLQRTRADFENYRKRVEVEKETARDAGKTTAIMQLLPVIDSIERAIAHVPAELSKNTWAQSITALVKQLDRSLESLSIKRIEATEGTVFNPEHHEAIQFDEEAEGNQEVIAEEVQAGYTLRGRPIRPAMVKVTKK